MVLNNRKFTYKNGVIIYTIKDKYIYKSGHWILEK